MKQQERFDNIVEYLKKNRTAKLDELSELNQVSLDTVRRDLKNLEKLDVLKRVRGGAVSHEINLPTLAFDVRSIVNSREKKELASLIADYVIDGQTIAMNSGTTTLEVARVLVEKFNSLTVITNDLHIIRMLSTRRGFVVIVPGGVVDSNEDAIIGDSCERDISKYNADLAILAVNAISLEKGVTDFRLNQVGIVETMKQIANKVFVVADFSKFGRTSSMNILSLSEIDYIVSDSKFPDEYRQPLEDIGIRMVTP